jgi:hypothetical protein
VFVCYLSPPPTLIARLLYSRIANVRLEDLEHG